jgi:hypothetical protein
MVHLQYLGLSLDEIKALREAVKAQHPKGGMQTAMGCCCGSGGGGPAGSLACRALEALMYAGQQAMLERPPRRDPRVCNHEYQGKVRIWEYQGDTICELCASKV